MICEDTRRRLHVCLLYLVNRLCLRILLLHWTVVAQILYTFIWHAHFDGRRCRSGYRWGLRALGDRRVQTPHLLGMHRAGMHRRDGCYGHLTNESNFCRA